MVTSQLRHKLQLALKALENVGDNVPVSVTTTDEGLADIENLNVYFADEEGNELEEDGELAIVVVAIDIK